MRRLGWAAFKLAFPIERKTYQSPMLRLLCLYIEDRSLMKVLLANKFLYERGGAETVLFQERTFLTETGTEVIDFAMQHERNVHSPHAANFVSRQDYRTGGYLSRIKGALALIHSREAVRK